MNKSFRIKTTPGGGDKVLNININQDFDFIDVLSLKLTQEEVYKIYSSDYGVIVGRVIANEGFGVPNAKVSVFIPADDETITNNIKNNIYPYQSIASEDSNGIKYNLLPRDRGLYDNSNICHQYIGTFPDKTFMLNNNSVLEVFDKYYKFTTTTNEAGDYMLFGVSVGNHTLHVDVDLSDIGPVLSQSPRDMTYKGYNVEQFDSPSMFKNSTNLNDLAQLKTEDVSVYVYPFWGDVENGDIAISRQDVKLQYKFEPTCVFMGSIITDSGKGMVMKNCKSYKELGKMDTLVSGEGTIEMIRKTFDDSVENFQIKGNALINGDGVWCYQIPMNLDYMITDEFGNMVQTDDSTKGIPTRTKVRFRIGFNDDKETFAFKKKKTKSKMSAYYLVPNNPDIIEDYEFGINTNDKSFVDFFMNKVYTVKNYIPRFQIGNRYKSRKFVGIKSINDYGNNNPLPYNSLYTRRPIIYILMCVIVNILLLLMPIYNKLMGFLFNIINGLKNLIDKIRKFTGIGRGGLVNSLNETLEGMRCLYIGSFCEDISKVFAPGCSGKIENNTNNDLPPEEQIDSEYPDSEIRNVLMKCLRNQLAQDTGAINFDFYDDWINGVLYAPQFLIKNKKKTRRRFLGLFGKKTVKDVTKYCGSKSQYSRTRVVNACAPKMTLNANEYTIDIKEANIKNCNDGKCMSESSSVECRSGLIRTYAEQDDSNIYYYNTQSNGLNLLSTGIVLLGALNECDIDGIPTLQMYLPTTSFKQVPNMVETDNDFDEDNMGHIDLVSGEVEVTGWDWSFRGGGQALPTDNKDVSFGDGGLFVGLDCNKIHTRVKSCVNAERLCEIGVSLDETFDSFRNCQINRVLADGYISKDSLDDSEVRQMFATLNSNNLNTIVDDSGNIKYDFIYLYPDNFDGKLRDNMTRFHSNFNETQHYTETSVDADNVLETTDNKITDVGYLGAYNREYASRDYLRFRCGLVDDNKSYPNIRFLDSDKKILKYVNSYYFYFGIKPGSTALDIFNRDFYSPCKRAIAEAFKVKFEVDGDLYKCPCDINSNELKVFIILENKGNYQITVIDPDGETVINNEELQYNNEKVQINPNNEMVKGGVYSIQVTNDSGQTVNTNLTLTPNNGIDFRTIQGVLRGDTSEYTVEQRSECLKNDDKKASVRIIIDKPIGGGCSVNDFKIVVNRFGDDINFSENLSNITPLVDDDINVIYTIYLTDGQYSITIIKEGDTDICVMAIQSGINIDNVEELELIINNVSNATLNYDILTENGVNGRDGYKALFKTLMKDLNTKYTKWINYGETTEQEDIRAINVNVLRSFAYFDNNVNLSIRTYGGIQPPVYFVSGNSSIPSDVITVGTLEQLSNTVGDATKVYYVEENGLCYTYVQYGDKIGYHGYGTNIWTLDGDGSYSTTQQTFTGEFNGDEVNQNPIQPKIGANDIYQLNTSPTTVAFTIDKYEDDPSTGCGETTGRGYRVAVVDNNGLSNSVPKGLSDEMVQHEDEYITDGMTLRRFEDLKLLNNTNNKNNKNSYLYHTIDCRLKLVEELIRTSKYFIWDNSNYVFVYNYNFENSYSGGYGTLEYNIVDFSDVYFGMEKDVVYKNYPYITTFNYKNPIVFYDENVTFGTEIVSTTEEFSSIALSKTVSFDNDIYFQDIVCDINNNSMSVLVRNATDNGKCFIMTGDYIKLDTVAKEWFNYYTDYCPLPVGATPNFININGVEMDRNGAIFTNRSFPDGRYFAVYIAEDGSRFFSKVFDFTPPNVTTFTQTTTTTYTFNFSNLYSNSTSGATRLRGNVVYRSDNSPVPGSGFSYNTATSTVTITGITDITTIKVAITDISGLITFIYPN